MVKTGMMGNLLSAGGGMRDEGRSSHLLELKHSRGGWLGGRRRWEGRNMSEAQKWVSVSLQYVGYVFFAEVLFFFLF